ncbi:MAG: RluA family pseudouridine synthase [Clostridia bacterium]|nr:RluA family pseudouridine synthase [Clostridia bacterium]
MNLNYTIKESDRYENLLDVLKGHFQISERLLLKLKRQNKIFLNKKTSTINSKVYANDVVEINIDFEEDNSNIVPINLPIDIIYEDDCLLIINKSSGCAVHPSMLHYEDSLSNRVKYYFDTINLHKKIRPINRLDKDTSGIVLFAKNEYIQECLVKQMKTNTFKKEYLAIVEGEMTKKEDTITLPISRKDGSIIERCVDVNGAHSITHYTVLGYNNIENISLIKCLLETGRTHQIRVHLSYIGHPILGDTLYGNKSSLINRQALHAYRVTFIHPITNEEICLESDFEFDIDFDYI